MFQCACGGDRSDGMGPEPHGVRVDPSPAQLPSPLRHRYRHRSCQRRRVPPRARWRPLAINNKKRRSHAFTGLTPSTRYILFSHARYNKSLPISCDLRPTQTIQLDTTWAWWLNLKIWKKTAINVIIIIDLWISDTDGGAGAGDARPCDRGTRGQSKTISHLNPLSVHGWVSSVPALWSKRKWPSRPGHYSRLPACCRFRPHRVDDGAACHRRIRYGFVCLLPIVASCSPLTADSVLRNLRNLRCCAVLSLARSFVRSARLDSASPRYTQHSGPVVSTSWYIYLLSKPVTIFL